MILEHLIYNLAIALFIMATIPKFTWRSGAWIIVASSYSPDCDIFIGLTRYYPGIAQAFFHTYSYHGYFHNIGILLVYALIVGVILHPFRVQFMTSFLTAGVGFGAHLFEDALVFNPGYEFFWPISSDNTGIGFFAPYTRNFFGVANTTALLLSIVLVFIMISIGIFRKRWIMNV